MNKRIFRLLLLVSLLSFGGQLALYPSLPARIPIRWSPQGQLDALGPKSSLLVLSLLPLLLLFLFWLLPRIDSRSENYKLHARAYSIFAGVITLGFVIINWVITTNVLGVQLPVLSAVALLAGFILLVMGNYTPQLHSNYFIGFRTPWALKNEQVWRKTNRAGGVFLCAYAALMILLVFTASPLWALRSLVLLVPGVIGITIYSYKVYRNIQHNREDHHAKN